ncbi:hypothetical protein [Natrinema soli]|uniref:Uncharacterized protein n=1 Tax=Natrinema soli TaxID=1930624 RepID=A0ABD5SKP6_9EURY|nr:hypothetical protein [Natrinema soli]
MSIQPRIHETVSDEPTDDHTSIELNEIVAQTVPTGDELPDFQEFNAVCKATKDTLEHVIEQGADL